jgi:hypothetical protein
MSAAATQPNLAAIAILPPLLAKERSSQGPGRALAVDLSFRFKQVVAKDDVV